MADKLRAAGNPSDSKGDGLKSHNSRFQGKTEDLKGYIYDSNEGRQGDQFERTTQMIANYVGRTYKYGGSIRTAIQQLSIPTLTALTYPTNNDPGELALWNLEAKQHIIEKSTLTENVKAAYSLIWGQCTEVMRAKIEALQGHTTIELQLNGIELLKEIKQVCYNYDSQKFPAYSVHQAMRKFYTSSQGHNSPVAYYESYNASVQHLESCGGSFPCSDILEKIIAKDKKIDYAKATAAELTTCQDGAKELYLATAFLLACDRRRYSSLIQDLENGYT